jgi:hypothetical protein
MLRHKQQGELVNLLLYFSFQNKGSGLENVERSTQWSTHFSDELSDILRNLLLLIISVFTFVADRNSLQRKSHCICAVYNQKFFIFDLRFSKRWL